MPLGSPRLIAAAACLAACAVVLVAGPINPPAGPVQSTQLALDDVEPRTPLTAEFVAGDSTSVFLIDQPGHYFLTADVLAGNTQNGIVINANNVTLDLNGYTVRGLSGSLDAITTAGAQSNITIRNGIIDAQLVGIRLQGSSRRVLIEDIVIEGAGDDGIDGSADTTILNCTIVASRNAIDVAGRCRIENCTLSAQDDGIRGGGSMIIRNNFITAANDGTGDGIDIEFDSIVDNNAVFSSGDRGIRAVQSRITNNVVEGANVGIVSSGVTSGNVVKGSNFGISQVGGTVTNNQIQQTQSVGITTASGICEGNSVNIRTGTGISATSNATIRNNTIEDEVESGTTIGIRVSSPFATVEGNTISNVATGISATSNRRAIIRGNTALNVADAYGSIDPVGNALAPIEVLDAASTTITSTSPFTNFDYRP